MAPGPKDKCPCGSGRKYKKCCMPQDSTEAADLAEHKYAIIRRCAERMYHNLMAAAGHFGVLDDTEAFLRLFFGDFNHSAFDPEHFTQFIEHWLPFCYPVLRQRSGQPEVTVAEAYYQDCAHKLRQDDRRLLEAVKDEPFCFYFVEEPGPVPFCQLRNIQSGRRHKVMDYQASETLRKGQIILARVAVMYGVEFIFGSAPYTLPPTDYPEREMGTI